LCVRKRVILASALMLLIGVSFTPVRSICQVVPSCRYGVPVPELNAVGDLVLTEASEFRALADPLALRLVDRLRPASPATTAGLAALTGASGTDVDARLSELERAGLVTGDSDGWRKLGSGVFFEIPDDPEGQAAARALTGTMLLQYVDLPRQWVEEVEPGLELDWARAAGMLNAGVALTPAELQAVQEELENVLTPYLTRAAEDAPPDARRVRLLAYFMPEAAA
jgi:DNA-binding transcriptional ArsR family regulator